MALLNSEPSLVKLPAATEKLYASESSPYDEDYPCSPACSTGKPEGAKWGRKPERGMPDGGLRSPPSHKGSGSGSPVLTTPDSSVLTIGRQLEPGAIIKSTIPSSSYISSKRNTAFHDLFPQVLVSDDLIEVTNIEKNMTDHTLNAIHIYSRTTRYTFISFLLRDKVYDLMHNIWHRCRPELESGGSLGDSTAALPLLAENITISKPLDKVSHNNRSSVSTKSSIDPTENNTPSLNEGILRPILTEPTSHASQQANNVTDVLQSHEPQYMANVMYECLIQHGCPDLMSSIDPHGFSSSAVAEGGYGDIWTGRSHNDGTKLAIKVLRFTLSTGEVARKELKFVLIAHHA
ncbi:unnamed protein product [Rhizoctonia solani]|uniref:Protein kinase domain-containing protein n=1 Tax=Rhizoctonia solani TaxID=456999 RepID=A0A8H3D0U7_9AGAM|nr:unnamed protein product [Rhizoctonia solani]